MLLPLVSIWCKKLTFSGKFPNDQRRIYWLETKTNETCKFVPGEIPGHPYNDSPQQNKQKIEQQHTTTNTATSRAATVHLYVALSGMEFMYLFL